MNEGWKRLAVAGILAIHGSAVLHASAAWQSIESPGEVISPRLLGRYLESRPSLLREGDVATLFHEAEAAEVSVMLSGDLLPMQRVPDSDIWFVSRELEHLGEGMLNYSFRVKQAPDSAAVTTETRYWRGPDCPPPPERARVLQGTLRTVDFESKSLGTTRKVTVYVPPGSTEGEAAPVVYMADGEAVGEFARVLEPLVLSLEIPKVVLVGTHSGGYIGNPSLDLSDYDPSKDLRAAEYLPMMNSEHFGAHERFFCEEVPAWAEQEFGVSGDRDLKAVFGFSNGGRFAVTMGLRHPDRFGTAIAFSVAAGDAPVLAVPPEESATFFFAAGIWEPGFHRLTTDIYTSLDDAGVVAYFPSRVSSHDHLMWQEEFAAAVVEAFHEF